MPLHFYWQRINDKKDRKLYDGQEDGATRPLQSLKVAHKENSIAIHDC